MFTQKYFKDSKRALAFCEEVGGYLALRGSIWYDTAIISTKDSEGLEEEFPIVVVYEKTE